MIEDCGGRYKFEAAAHLERGVAKINRIASFRKRGCTPVHYFRILNFEIV